MDFLKLENQLCFPLYALSRSMTAHYQPILEKLHLTYPQYLVMLVMWEHQELSVKEIGSKLMLDSGTLTPLLKRLEEKSLLSRTRSKSDERIVVVKLSNEGIELKKEAEKVPGEFLCSLNVSIEEVVSLRDILFTLLEKTKLKTNKNSIK